MSWTKSTINWADLEQVKAYATKLARMSSGQNTVFKTEGVANYTICPTAQENKYLRLPGVTKVYQTGNFKK